MEENVNAPSEKKPNFLKQAWEKTAPIRAWPVKAWKAIRNPLGWFIGISGLLGFGAFMASLNVSGPNAPKDKNGRDFTLLEQYVLTRSMNSQLEAIRQDSIFQAKQDSLERVRQLKADSIARQDSISKAEMAKKKMKPRTQPAQRPQTRIPQKH